MSDKTTIGEHLAVLALFIPALLWSTFVFITLRDKEKEVEHG